MIIKDNTKQVKNLTEPKELKVDRSLTNLRPRDLGSFVGQDKIKENISIFIESAKKRKEPLEHFLFYGPPGTGKTTLSHIIAHEMNVNVKTTSGPTLKRAGELGSILTNLKENDILFIDEIHRLNTSVEEILYSAMEDYFIDIVLGKGPGAKSIKLDLAKFTLVGATTRISMLSPPLRDRFGSIHRLNYYETGDLECIIARSAKLLGLKINLEAIHEIAKRSRRTPRIANRLLKRIRDFSCVKECGPITIDTVHKCLDLLEIDGLGLDEIDRRILQTLIEKFSGGPTGVENIAAATAEEEDTIKNVYEPFLIQSGLMTRTPRGRIATKLAYSHLGLPYPEQT